MANKKPASKAKKRGLSGREIFLIFIIAVLIVALLVSIFAGDDLFSGLRGVNDDGNTQGPSDETGDNVLVGYNAVYFGSTPVYLPAEIDAESSLQLHFVNVGQGDGIVCKLPDGKILLIDAGSGTSVSAATRATYLSYLSSTVAIERVDYMVITHPDSDHVNMAASVLEAYDVYNIYYNDYANASKTYTSFMTAAQAETCAELYVIESESETFRIEGENYVFTLYAPGNTGFSGADSATNSMSIICVLEYGGRTVLLMGDAEVETEEWFMAEVDEDFDADVLKVGHHGSSSCTSTDFLDFIDAEYAVISCGLGNSYGHPTAQTMNRLFSYGLVTYRTDRHGNIVLFIDSDGDFAFLPDNPVQVENNTKERNPFLLLKEALNG